MWPRGAVFAIISTRHDKDDDCEDRRQRVRRVSCNVYKTEARGAKKMGPSSTGWSDAAVCLDLPGASFSHQSTKRVEGAEWSRYVRSGKIVRGFSARDDEERARRIAAGKKSARSDEPRR